MGSDGCEAGAGESGRISIHAPRMGSDDCPLDAILISMRFQSTLPGWGATLRRCNPLCRARDFNPRSPDGERPNRATDNSQRSIFQSTLPGWGATMRPLTVSHGAPISIHAPRMGSDGRHGADGAGHLISIHAPRMGSDRENGHLRPRYGQNHPFSTLIVSQIVVDVLGTVRKSQKTPAH